MPFEMAELNRAAFLNFRLTGEDDAAGKDKKGDKKKKKK